MMFILGFLAGLLVATIIIVTLTFFRAVLEKHITVVEKVITNAGPRPQGMVYEPESDADERRAEIIEENRAQGKDTRISELL